MTTMEMIKKANKTGGYFKFTGPRMVNGTLTPTSIAASQRDCDRTTGEKLPETATDFFFSEYRNAGKMVSREEAERVLAEIE